MMDLIIHMLGPDMDPVLEQLEELGERHAAHFGVCSKHYPIFGEALLNTMELLLDRQWKPAVRDAWLSLWRIMSLTMLRGARIVTRRRRKEKIRLLESQQKLSEEGPADLTESHSSLTSSLTSLSLSDSQRKQNSPPTPSKPRSSSRNIMVASGHGSSTSYLTLSDDEDFDFSPAKKPASMMSLGKKGKTTKKKSKKSGSLNKSEHDEPRKPNSLNGSFRSYLDDDDHETSKKPPSGRSKQKELIRSPRPGLGRAESCRMKSISTSEHKASPRNGMVQRMSSFRLRKRENGPSLALGDSLGQGD
jgi:hypothetical protein